MKLTKTQIEALARRIQKKLQEKLIAEKDAQIEAIKKTSEYKKLEKLLKARDEKEEQLNKLDLEINEIAKLPFKRSKLVTIEAYINCKLSKNPTLDTIIEDITIATIDRNFNVDEFINNYINNE